MPTPLHVYAEQKRLKREAQRQANPPAEAPPPVEPAPAPVVMPPTEAAVERIQAYVVEAHAALQQADTHLASASYDALTAEDDSAADAVLQEARQVRDRAHERLQATQAALAVATDKQDQARAQTAHDTHTAAVAKVTTLLATRTEVAARLAKDIEATVASYRELINATTEAHHSYPGRVPHGGMLAAGEIVKAVAAELHRVSADPFRGGDMAETRIPAFPGAAAPTIQLIGTPDRVPSLVDRLADAGVYILASLTSMPPGVLAPVARPAPASPPVASAPVPAEPTRTAAEIQAEIPKLDLSQYLPSAAPAAHPNLAPAIADVDTAFANPGEADDVPTLSTVL